MRPGNAGVVLRVHPVGAPRRAMQSAPSHGSAWGGRERISGKTTHARGGDNATRAGARPGGTHREGCVAVADARTEARVKEPNSAVRPARRMAPQAEASGCEPGRTSGANEGPFLVPVAPTLGCRNETPLPAHRHNNTRCFCAHCAANA